MRAILGGFVGALIAIGAFALAAHLKLLEADNEDGDSLSSFGDSLFGLVSKEKRAGQIDLSQEHRLLVIHGPFDRPIKSAHQLTELIREFEETASKHVTKALQTHHERNGRSVGFGTGLLKKAKGFGGNRSSSGYPDTAHGGGSKEYVTLAITYDRDKARGTAVLHLSLEAKIAVLTISEFSR